VGAVLTGVVLALFKPLTRWPLGTMLVGILCGMMIYGAVAPAAELGDLLEGKEPSSVVEMIWIAIGCGVMAGPPAALGFRYRGDT
jgi:hypothetical protein